MDVDPDHWILSHTTAALGLATAPAEPMGQARVFGHMLHYALPAAHTLRSCTLVDMLGHTLVLPCPAAPHGTLPLPTLPAGVYQAVLNTTGGAITTRFVVE